jgi:thiosulfate dehydrogenase (quinone) large subunit
MSYFPAKGIKEIAMSILNFRNNRVFQDPPLAQKLFNSSRAAWLWLPLRIYLGYQWIDASMHKINEPAWVVTGEALKGFWTRIVQIPAEGSAPIKYDWYRSFIQMLLNAEAYTWFAKLIAYGELLVGICLIVGAFTGFAALAGATMNFNFMLAGSASSNPVLFFIAILLIMAWKVAGLVGADYVLLPLIGTPWKAKKIEEGEAAERKVPAPA